MLTCKIKLKFRNSTLAPTLAHTIDSVPNPNLTHTVRHMSVSHAFKQNREDCYGQRNETLHIFRRWFEFIRDIFPGGSWWNLSDIEQKIDRSPIAAKPITVLKALSQMWALVADEKWILYTAFGALTVAAVRVLIYVVSFLLCL